MEWYPYQTWRKTDKLLFESWKTKATNTTARHLIDDAKDITNLKKINACICKYYKNLFKRNVSKSDSERESFLNNIALPNLICESESEITEKYLITAFKSMPNPQMYAQK